MNLCRWSGGLLISLALAPLACKTTKSKKKTSAPPKPGVVATEPQACAALALTFSPQPAVDPGSLALKSVTVNAQPIGVKSGTNYAAEILIEASSASPAADVYYIKACDKGGKTQDPLRCKGHDTIVRTSGDTENRFLPGIYSVSAYACVWQNRLAQGANPNGFVSVKPSDYPTRSLFCGKNAVKTVYQQPTNSDSELARLMGEQSRARAQMHQLVYGMKDKLGQQSGAGLGLAGSSNAATAFNTQVANLVHMGETSNVLLVESSAYDEAVANTLTLAAKKASSASSMALTADSTNPCVTNEEIDPIIPPVGTGEIPTTIDPDVPQEPLPTEETPEAEVEVDQEALDKAACQRRGPEFVYERDRCWQDKGNGTLTEITPSGVEVAPTPGPVNTVPDSRDGLTGKQWWGVALVATGSIVVATSVAATIQGNRVLMANSANLASDAGSSSTLERFFKPVRANVTSDLVRTNIGVDSLGRANVNIGLIGAESSGALPNKGSSWLDRIKTSASRVGETIDSKSGTFFESLGKTSVGSQFGSSGATTNVDGIKGAKAGLLGGAVGMLVGVAMITVGSLLGDETLALAANSPETSVKGNLEIINPVAERLRLLRYQYIKTGELIDNRLQ